MTSNLPDAEAALLGATLEASSNVPVPKKNQTEFCLSCGAATPQRFCGECGLKNDDLRRSLFRLITETLGGIFSFEGRMWRTWAALLFKPGKVAREYSDGKRTTYSSPIRVYLVVTFLLLTYLAISQTNLFAVVVTPKTPEQIAAEKLISDKKEKLVVTTTSIGKSTTAPKNESSKPIGIEDIVEMDDEAVDEMLDESEVKFELNDYNFKTLFFQPQSKFDALYDKASAEGFANTVQNQSTSNVGQSINIQKAMTVFLTNPIRFNQQFNTWLPRAMFLMVPMVMFLGVIYIRGPNALLYDHLIHAIYIHTIFFISLLVAILLSKVLNGATVARILFILILIYLPLSLKRMFGRGWFKTIWTTLNIGFIYMIMLTITMSIITAYSFTQLAA